MALEHTQYDECLLTHSLTLSLKVQFQFNVIYWQEIHFVNITKANMIRILNGTIKKLMIINTNIRDPDS